MENHKVRFVIPRYTYNDARVELVKKICPLSFRQRPLRRAFDILNKNGDVPCLEGVLESKDRLAAVERRLSDEPIRVQQGDVDMPTYLIDDGELANDMCCD